MGDVRIGFRYALNLSRDPDLAEAPGTLTRDLPPEGSVTAQRTATTTPKCDHTGLSVVPAPLDPAGRVQEAGLSTPQPAHRQVLNGQVDDSPVVRGIQVALMEADALEDLSNQFAAFKRDYPYRDIFCDGRRWRYRIGGAADGPPVLVLTGATTVPDPLFVIIADLGQQYRVIAPAYPPASRITDLIDGIAALLDAEHVTTVHMVGSSFGGYLAQSLLRAYPERVDKLVLAQTGVRHFAGSGAMTMLRRLLGVAPTRVVKAFTWRTWQLLLTDLGEDGPFWTALLRDILDRQLTKTQLLAVMAAIADFTAHHRPLPGSTVASGPVLVLASEHDRAFARQASEMRAVYPHATFRTLVGAGHGALFTHTDEYIAEVRVFLKAPESTELRP